VPEVAVEVVQLAAQEVALVALQVIVEEPPDAILVGEAETETVGAVAAAVTVTVAELLPEPNVFEHVMV
jgi:hypothetical protein